MNLMVDIAAEQAAVPFTLNGKAVSAQPGETIIQAAARHGVDIPHLCYAENMRPDGNCRACVVEIEGERVLAPSCCRAPSAGMVVSSVSARALHSQRMVLELLQSDMPPRDYKLDSELQHYVRELEVGKPRFEPRMSPGADLSHPAIAVNLDACIQCTRCVRACREVQVNDVIGYAFRGNRSLPVFDLDDPMGASTCVACGECVQACPTGALMPARDAGSRRGRQDGGFRVPVLRCRLPADLSREGQPHRARGGPRRPGQSRPVVREGPLRLRLRASQATAHEAPDPPRRRAEVRRLHDGSGRRDARVPRGDVGGGPGARGREAAPGARRARSGRTRRLRLRQGQQRGGVSLPEARADRVSQQQRRSLHATVSRVERCGAHGGHRIRCRVQSGHGRAQGRRRAPDRRQSDREPSGRRDVDQERHEAGHEARARRPAPFGTGAPRGVLPAVQARHRRRAAQRDDAHDRHGRARGRSLRRRSHQRLRRAAPQRRRLQRRGDGADLRHSRRRRSGKWRVSSRRRAPR